MSLRIENINKRYQENVLEDITFEFKKGLYGLVAPNGTGKTTLLRIISGVEKATSGAIFYNDIDIKTLGEKYREKIGYLPQEFGFYPNFTARQMLEYIAELKGIKKSKVSECVEEALKLVHLDDINKQIKNFSGGMKQRLGIAQAIVGKPEILILDEPTVGLDIAERNSFKKFISEYSLNNTVILSSHIVSDIEDISNHVVILRDRRIYKEGRPGELMDSLKGKVWEVQCHENELLFYKKNYNVTKVHFENGIETLRIIAEDYPGDNAEVVTPNLEDVYIEMFGSNV